MSGLKCWRHSRLWWAAAMALLAGPAAGDDWPQFRGPGGTGVSSEKKLPLEWGRDKNVRWRVEMPAAGNSSPIVSRGRVFVTVAEEKGKQRHLLCLDRKSGKELWRRTVTRPAGDKTHAANPHCAATPCADGERVVVWQAAAGLHCYDYEGKKLWSLDPGGVGHEWGEGSSPVIHGDRVLLNWGPGVKTSLFSVEKHSGKTVWKHDETGGDNKKWIGSWATPLVTKVGGKDQIILGYPRHVKGFDPASGKVLWTCEGLSDLVYADVALGDGVGVATGEDEGGETVAFRLGGEGNVTATHRLWSRKRKMEVGTGVIIGRHLWTADDPGFIRCTEVSTGREVLKERSPKGGAWGSIISAAGRLYVTTKSGHTVVFRPDLKGIKILAVNGFGEKSNSTPAISDGEIFLRTRAAVYCVSESR